jgi:hypothetical protein
MPLTEKPESCQSLITQVQQADRQLTGLAAKAVNISLTLHNWLMGITLLNTPLQRWTNNCLFPNIILSDLKNK